jgi:hypothetical protein
MSVVNHAMPGDIPLDEIAEDVQEARDALLRTVNEHPTHAWRPRELMSASKGTLSNTVVSIAFWSLVEAGDLEVDEQLVVRAVQLH